MWGYGPMMGYGYGRGMGWAMAADGVFWALLLVLAVALVLRILHGQGGPLRRRGTALDILEERYARGEIERDDYLQKRKDLLNRRSA